MQFFLKILGGMANSVDHDQTAPSGAVPDQTDPSGAVWSGSTLFAYAILSELLVYKTLGHLQYSSDAPCQATSNGYPQHVFMQKQEN